MLEAKNVKAVFCGHDHYNDLGGFIKNDPIELVYGRKSGFGGYQSSTLTRGGRLITIVEKIDE
jgi:hypothetical protein